MAEAERYLPKLMTELETLGYGDEKIKIRMSGCPNSCSRPPVSEIGLIGSTLNKYNIYLGGDHLGKRLNRLFLELVDDSKLSLIISKLIEHWKGNRINNDESFGDFYNNQDFEKIKQLVQ